MIKIKLKNKSSSASSSKSKSGKSKSGTSKSGKSKSGKSSKSSTKRSKGTKKVLRAETKKSNKRKIIFLEKIKVVKSEDKKHFKPSKTEQVSPKLWELPNRKTFYTWLNKNFKDYEVSQYEKGKKVSSEKRELFRIQKLVRDFMQDGSPYRGLMLYHGLGTGKTCSAISIAESILSLKEVVFMSKAALEKNFVGGINDCGRHYMKTDNYWVHISGESKYEKELIKELNIPASTIKENNGAYLIDFRVKNGNYKELGSHQSKLLKQIEAMTNDRFKFLHLDDTRILKKIEEGDFDNKVVIIDEVHNLTNSMANGTPTGTRLYELLLNAKNCKMIFLSGTPMINTIFELTRIYNLLMGPIATLVYKLIPDFGKNINYSIVKSHFITDKNVDQVFVDKIRKTVKITKNPDNFITHMSKKGLKHSESLSESFDDFKKRIDEEMNKLSKNAGFSKVLSVVETNTCLLEDKKDFDKMFYNSDLNKLKKSDILKKRIAGLTSYYEKIDKTKFPKLNSVDIVQVPMSDYQLTKYQPFRMVEIEKQKKMARRKEGEEQMQSTYRIYSRLHCSFAFPEAIGSPYDKDKVEMYEKLEKVLGEGVDIFNEDKMGSTKKEITKEEIDIDKLGKKYVDALDKKRDEFMSMENGSLQIYGPKYAKIIKSIMASSGCCFVYSQFIEKVGLNTFAVALKATNQFVELKLGKEDGQYVIKNGKEDKDKMKYIFYAGKVSDPELRDIYRLIYNSEFDKLPLNCSKLKKQLLKDYGEDQNLHGKIIKVFLTTRSGAEGVDLKHIRQIHIMESYWQPVLIQQIIGRGVRFESHTRLPESERNVSVFIYLATITDKQLQTISSGAIRQDKSAYNVSGYNKKGRVITSDEYLYITAERKKAIIDQAQKVIKQSAFDCTLNFTDNVEVDGNENLVCMNYNQVNREDDSSYLTSSSLDDTIDIIDIQQEDVVTITFQKIELPRNSGKFYYRLQTPQPGERHFLFSGDQNPAKMPRRPRPVGEILEVDGKRKIRFFKQKDKSKPKTNFT